MGGGGGGGSGSGYVGGGGGSDLLAGGTSHPTSQATEVIITYIVSIPTDTATNTPAPTDTATNTPVPSTATNTPVPTDTATITPVQAKVTLGALSQTYDGTAKVASAGVSPSACGPVSLTYQ